MQGGLHVGGYPGHSAKLVKRVLLEWLLSGAASLATVFTTHTPFGSLALVVRHSDSGSSSTATMSPTPGRREWE
jgi:hypothetical protein